MEEFSQMIAAELKTAGTSHSQYTQTAPGRSDHSFHQPLP